MKKGKWKRLRERIAELEAMVAMAEQPSPDKWDFRVCLSWVHEQMKIRRRLDKIAAKMKAKEDAR